MMFSLREHSQLRATNVSRQYGCSARSRKAKIPSTVALSASLYLSFTLLVFHEASEERVDARILAQRV